jgi:Domain of unknown function (DUF6457)
MADETGNDERSAAGWIRQFAAAIGQEAPTQQQMSAILKLAAVAAHASHRTAAPMACWLAGISGRDLDELIAEAERIAAS